MSIIKTLIGSLWSYTGADQWQPTTTSHDPNPPLSISDAPFSTQPTAGADLRKVLLLGSATQAVNLAILLSQAVAPFFGNTSNSVAASPYLLRHLNADTSHGVPKTLYADALAPFKTALSTLVEAPKPVFAQSFGTPLTLSAATPAPFQTQASLSAADFRRVHNDTSYGIPKTLTLDATTPFQIPLTSFAGRLPWQIAGTSYGIPKTLTQDATTPFFVNPLALIGSPQQPFAQSFGVPLTLLAVTPAPFQTAIMPSALRATWQFVDTSQGMPLTLASVVAPLPFIQTLWPAPIEYRQFQNYAHDSPYPTAFIVPVVVAAPTEGGKHHPEYDIRDPRHPYWTKREVVKDPTVTPSLTVEQAEVTDPLHSPLEVNRLPVVTAREALKKLLTDEQRSVLDEIKSTKPPGIAFDDDDDDDILLLLLID